MDAGQFSILGTLPDSDNVENNTSKLSHPPSAPLFKLKLGSSEDKSDLHVTKYYNNHLLHVTSGVAYQSQVVDVIKMAIADINKILPQPINCDFKVNLVTDRNNTYFGYGYAWVSSIEIYNVLLGKNSDGSERIDYVDDPNWKSPATALEDALNTLDDSLSWGEYMDKEDEIKALYTAPQIKTTLPPLIQLKPIIYDAYQSEYMKQYLSHPEASKVYKSFGTDSCIIQIASSFVDDPDEKFCPNVLCARNIPMWVYEKDLKSIFTLYASNPTSEILRKNKDKRFYDTYPFVTINDRRVAFITYDPSTKDALFALPMVRKLVVTKDRLNCTLIFNHSFRTL